MASGLKKHSVQSSKSSGSSVRADRRSRCVGLLRRRRRSLSSSIQPGGFISTADLLQHMSSEASLECLDCSADGYLQSVLPRRTWSEVRAVEANTPLAISDQHTIDRARHRAAPPTNSCATDKVTGLASAECSGHVTHEVVRSLENDAPPRAMVPEAPVSAPGLSAPARPQKRWQ